MHDKFTLQVVGVKGAGVAWAIKATYHGQTRYRGYHYKTEAIKGMKEWEDWEPWSFGREFYHNFFSAEELHIKSE